MGGPRRLYHRQFTALRLDIVRHQHGVEDNKVPNSEQQTHTYPRGLPAGLHDMMLANSATERFSSKKIKPSFASRVTNRSKAASSLTEFTIT